MKRILILGVAALVLAVLAPSIGTQGVSGLAVAQAQTPTDPADPRRPGGSCATPLSRRIPLIRGPR